jgi:hypothetical protein
MMRIQVRSIITALVALALLSLGAEGTSKLKLQSNGENQEQAELLTILRDEHLREHQPERVAKAIERLGEMKSVGAVDQLVQLLTFRRTFPWENNNLDVIQEDHPVTPLGRYPAAGALFQIGKPALPALIKVIETEETGSLAGENAIYTVTQIFRDSPARWAEYLKDAATRASSPQAARRLSGAAKKVKRFHQH